MSLLAINGLRILEARSADIDDLGIERGHCAQTVVRKGAKIVTIPLAPRTARATTSRSASDWTARSSGDPTGSGWTATAQAGSASGRPPCRRASTRCAESRLTRGPANRHALRPCSRVPRPPPTSSSPTSQAPPAEQPVAGSPAPPTTRAALCLEASACAAEGRLLGAQTGAHVR